MWTDECLFTKKGKNKYMHWLLLEKYKTTLFSRNAPPKKSVRVSVERNLEWKTVFHEDTLTATK